MKFKSVDLFSPYILVIIIAIYVGLAAIAYQEHLRNLQWISSTTWLYVLMGTLFFVAGVFLPKFIYNQCKTQITVGRGHGYSGKFSTMVQQTPYPAG